MESDGDPSVLSKLGILQVRILVLLKAGPLHGFGIIKELSQSYGWRPNNATIYPLLHSLKRRGYIRLHSRPEKSPTKVYALTESGRTILNSILGPSTSRCRMEHLLTNDSTPENFIKELQIGSGEKILYVFCRPWALQLLSSKAPATSTYVLLPLTRTMDYSTVHLPIEYRIARSLADLQDGLEFDRIISTNAFSPYESIIDPTIRSLDLEETLGKYCRLLRIDGELDILETAKHAVFEMYWKALVTGFLGEGSELNELAAQLKSRGFKILSQRERKGFVTLIARRESLAFQTLESLMEQRDSASLTNDECSISKLLQSLDF